MRSTRLIITSSLLLLLSACQDKGTEQAVEAKTASIKTQALSELAVPVSYSAPATASSLNESTLKAEITARIEAISVRVGDAVKAGDLLVKLNCDDAKAQLAQRRAQRDAANARAQLAKQQLERAVSLSKKRSVSEELLSQRKAEHQSANADVTAANANTSIAQNNVKRCAIRSPFNAIVTQRIAQVGELAIAASPMIKLVSTEGLEVSAEIVPETAISLEQAENIQFLSSQGYAVKLRTLTGVVGSLSRTREARLIFIDQQPLPGTPGRLNWQDARPGIPAQYLTERQGKLGVFIADNNIARFIPLPHAQEGRAVATELNADTPIITLGRNNVKDGQNISEQTQATPDEAAE